MLACVFEVALAAHGAQRKQILGETRVSGVPRSRVLKLRYAHFLGKMIEA